MGFTREPSQFQGGTVPSRRTLGDLIQAKNDGELERNQPFDFGAYPASQCLAQITEVVYTGNVKESEGASPLLDVLYYEWTQVAHVRKDAQPGAQFTVILKEKYGNNDNGLAARSWDNTKYHINDLVLIDFDASNTVHAVIVAGMEHIYVLENCVDANDKLYTKAEEWDGALGSVVKMTTHVCRKVRLATLAEYQANPLIQNYTSDDTLSVWDNCATCLAHYKLVDCDGVSASYCTDLDLSAITEDQAIKLHDIPGHPDLTGKCFTVEATSATCTDTWLELFTTNYEVLADCATCCQCWQVRQCGTSTYKYVYNSFPGMTEGSVYLDDDDGLCWMLSVLMTNCSSCTSQSWVHYTNVYDTCAECTTDFDKFKLTPACASGECEDALPTAVVIITRTPLTASLNQYIKINGICYLVTAATSEAVTQPSVEYTGPYATCELCQAAPVASTSLLIGGLVYIEGTCLKQYYQKIIIKNGLITAICPEESTEIDCGEECPESSSSSSSG
jgi:hypothetical protein